MYEHLSDFLSELDDDGELVRISAEVDPVLEIAAITDRVCRQSGDGPALFFDHVKDHQLPVVTNLLGSRRRMCRALGVTCLDEMAERIAAVIQPDVPEGWLETLKLVPQLAQLTKLPPKMVKTGVCQQVVHVGSDVTLDGLPIPHCWPGEAGPVITAGQLYTRDPRTKLRHVASVPLEVRDSKSLSIHWDLHQPHWQFLEEYRRADQLMPIAVALGGDPACSLMSRLPLPPQTDACLLGGFLRGGNIDLVPCRSIDLEVPAQAEIVIEGHVDPTADPEPAGPIGLPTGFYSSADRLPVLQVTALTHRANPIFSALIPGRTPAEEYWLGRAGERIVLPLIKLAVPELVDLHQPRAGRFRNLLFVSIRKQYPQQARKVMHALWSLGPTMVSKIIVVVDESVDVHDEDEVWFTVGSHVHPGRDVVLCEGPTHAHDHAAPVPGMGHKLGLDATRTLPQEGHDRPWPDPLAMPAEIAERVKNRWAEYGLDASADT